MSCCTECAQTGGSCGGALVRPVPGDESFPVGFGQPAGLGQVRGMGQILTTAGDAVTAWAVPLSVGVLAAVAGFGLAYVLVGRK